jgi:hypothetical protein
MAWTIATLSLLAAVFATNAHGASSGDAGLWMTAEPIDVDTARTTEPMAASDTGKAPGATLVGGGGGAVVPDPSATTTSTSTTPPEPPPTTPDNPPIVARPIPDAAPEPPPVKDPPPWAASVRTTDAGYIATDLGCAAGTSAPALDAFFAERLGPVIGEDYQHVVALGGNRYLWLFQDTFVDQGGTASQLDQATFMHNAAMVQDGTCFTLYTRGTPEAPTSFEEGTGERSLRNWFWPMGGETVDGRVYQFWVRMVKDPYEPGPGDGLGWHPESVWLSVYDASTLARLWFGPAADPGVTPIYGYAVASDDSYTYLFGNTFEQNLVREGGYANGPHSGTQTFLARVPRGEFSTLPEYRTADGWSAEPAAAVPVSSRYWVENPMQPRFLNGQWVAATKVDGYWGDELSIDVASEPWGPWTNVARNGLLPRDGDPVMNTYHAHLMPWLHDGALVVSVSQNARNMVRDAYPHPVRYRPRFFGEPLVPPPPPEPVPESTTTVPDTTTSSTTSTTVPDTTTSTSPSTTTSTTTPTTSTTVPESTSTTTPTSSSTSTTSPTSTTTSTTTPDTTAPPETGDAPPAGEGAPTQQSATSTP